MQGLESCNMLSSVGVRIWSLLPPSALLLEVAGAWSGGLVDHAGQVLTLDLVDVYCFKNLLQLGFGICARACNWRWQEGILLM